MKPNEEVRGAVCILEGVKNTEHARALIIWPEVYHFFADSFSKNKQNIEKIRFLLILFFFSKTTYFHWPFTLKVKTLYLPFFLDNQVELVLKFYPR